MIRKARTPSKLTVPRLDRFADSNSWRLAILRRPGEPRFWLWLRRADRPVLLTGRELRSKAAIGKRVILECTEWVNEDDFWELFGDRKYPGVIARLLDRASALAVDE